MAPQLTDALKRQAIDAVNAAIRAGFKWNGTPSALRAAAKSIGVKYQTLHSRVLLALEAGYELLPGAEPEPAPEIERISKPRIRVQAHSTSDAPKIGPVQSVSICNLGTCLPTGYVAEYAKVAMTGWSYSVWDLTLQGGRITGHRVISMDELERLYGD